MLGKLSGQKQPHSCLDFPRGDGGPLVVVGKPGSFTGDSLKDIVDEAVHDGHSFAGDSSVGVDLLENLVDVDCVGFLPLLLLFLISLGDAFLGLSGLLCSLS